MEVAKRLLVAAVILAVIVVMALRGCPRSRRHADAAPSILSCSVPAGFSHYRN